MTRPDGPERVPPGDDMILPFLLEVPDLRGRLVRLGPELDGIITRHDYPQPVAQLLAEMLALTCLLAGMLKFEGVFTLQTKGDGPLPLMVSDITSEGALRGYAKVDEALLAKVLEAAAGGPLPASLLIGQGVLAFTVDQGPQSERYQGIVELVGPSLADSVLHYFRQSEQVKAGIELAAGRTTGGWRAGGLLLQALPDDSEGRHALGSDEEDDWRRTQVLMASCSEQELLDPALSSHDLLFRLFHEERVRVFAARPLSAGCRCSRDGVTAMLRSLPKQEVLSLKEEGEVVVTCQFCNTDYRFDDEAVAALYAA
jgi:molecular chaperone Hsp33